MGVITIGVITMEVINIWVIKLGVTMIGIFSADEDEDACQTPKQHTAVHSHEQQEKKGWLRPRHHNRAVCTIESVAGAAPSAGVWPASADVTRGRLTLK